MKRVVLIVFLLVVFVAAVCAWIVLGSGTGFTAKSKALYIRSDAATPKAVLDSLLVNRIITNETAFDFLASRMDYWSNIKPGKYEFKKGSSLLSIVRRLRNGQQTPVNLVITKLRTREDLARLIGRRFETDSAQMIDFLTDPDSLRAYNVDPETATWHVLPDTYTYYWNSSPSNVYNKLYQESQKFWNEERKAKAAALGITPLQAYILASIVEEETNFLEEKDTIASVYINRVRMGMPLQADPTVKFAVRDFSITWVHGAMLQSESPYNTYRVKGLPPGPICTPSKKTIDEVLKAPQTNYLYFVASSRFDGTHMFSASYDEHMVKARAYQAEDKRRREARAAKKETAN